MSVQVKPGSTEWNLLCPVSLSASSRIIMMFASLDLGQLLILLVRGKVVRGNQVR